MFEDMFTQPDGEDELGTRTADGEKAQSLNMHLLEIKEFRDSRAPMRDSTGFWKFSRLARLKVCAKIIFRIPVSSAVIERRFFSPSVMKISR